MPHTGYNSTIGTQTIQILELQSTPPKCGQHASSPTTHKAKISSFLLEERPEGSRIESTDGEDASNDVAQRHREQIRQQEFGPRNASAKCHPHRDQEPCEGHKTSTSRYDGSAMWVWK